MALSVSHPHQPLTNIIPRPKALGMILVSLVDMGCDTKEPYNILYIKNDLVWRIYFIGKLVLKRRYPI